MELISFDSSSSSSSDDDASLQYLFKSIIMKMNSIDDYFDDEDDDYVEIFCQFSSSHCSQEKLNGSINGLLGLVTSRNYNMRICLQEHIECHLKPLEHL